jgi:hypothetical protein
MLMPAAHRAMMTAEHMWRTAYPHMKRKEPCFQKSRHSGGTAADGDLLGCDTMRGMAPGRGMGLDNRR